MKEANENFEDCVEYLIGELIEKKNQGICVKI